MDRVEGRGLLGRKIVAQLYAAMSAVCSLYVRRLPCHGPDRHGTWSCMYEIPGNTTNPSVTWSTMYMGAPQPGLCDPKSLNAITTTKGGRDE